MCVILMRATLFKYKVALFFKKECTDSNIKQKRVYLCQEEPYPISKACYTPTHTMKYRYQMQEMHRGTRIHK